MLPWPHLIIVGFLLFSVVTLYVATLELTLASLRTLGLAATVAYGTGVLGMVIAFTRVGTAGRLFAVLVFGLGTGGLVVLTILPRVAIGDLFPILP